MSIKTTITLIHTAETIQTVKDILQKQGSKPRAECIKLSNYFDALGGGLRKATMTVAVNTTGVKATGTVTLSSIAAADTVTIAGLVFTGSDTPSTTVQFLTGTTDTLSAVSLAAKINAHASLLGIVTATSALGVVTLTAVNTGLVYNRVGLAISAHGSVSGALMTGGTNDLLSPVSYSLG